MKTTDGQSITKRIGTRYGAPLAFSIAIALIVQQCLSKAQGAEQLDSILTKLEDSIQKVPSPGDSKNKFQVAIAAYKARHYPDAYKVLKEMLASSDYKLPADADSNLDEWLSLINCSVLLGDYDLSIKMFQKTLDKVDQPEQKAKVLNKLGAVYASIGNFNEAETQLRKATEICRINNISSSALAENSLALADSYRNQRRMITSGLMYAKATVESLRLGDPGKPLAAAAFDGDARVHEYFSERVFAKQKLDKALALKKEVFGEESLEFAESLSTLATLKQYEDSHDANQLRLKAIEIQTKLLGKTSVPLIAENMLRLSATVPGPYSEREALCQMARHSVDGVVDDDSPIVAAALHELARVNLNQKKIKAALANCTQAIEVEVKVYGSDSPFEADSLQTLATIIQADAIERATALGNNDEPIKCPQAEESLEKAIAIANKKLGKDSIQAAMYSSTLSSIKNSERDYAKAELLATKALNQCDGCLDPRDPFLNYTRKNLATALKKQSKNAEAKAVLVKLLDAQINQNGINSKEVRDTLVELEQVVEDKTEIADLRKKLLSNLPVVETEVLPIAIATELKDVSHLQRDGELKQKIDALIRRDEKLYGAESPKITQGLFFFAEYYTKTKKFSDAEAQYKRILSIQENAFGHQHPALIKILAKYGKFLAEMGNDRAAAALQVRLAQIRKAG